MTALHDHDRVPALLMPALVLDAEMVLPPESVLPVARSPVPARLSPALQRRPLPRDLAQPEWPIRIGPATGRLSPDTARRVLAANILNTAPPSRPAKPWRPDAWSILCGACGTVLALVIVAVVS